MSEGYVTLVHAFSGSMGGILSRTATAPADRIRTLMQAGLGVPLRPPGLTKVRMATKYGSFCAKGGSLRAVLHVYRDGGLLGFYRGNGANCLKVAPDAAVQFAVNRSVTRRFAGGDVRDATLAQRIISGGVSGAVSQTLIHPLDIVKTQMTIAETGEYSCLANCVQRTAHDERLGPNVVYRFYRGYGASLLGIVPYMAIKLGSYTWLCAEYSQRHGGVHIGGLADLVASASCSFAAISCAYPLNLARVKLQTQGVNGRSILYDGSIDCLRKTLRFEGVFGLFRGFSPNLLKALPAQSILLQVQRRLSDALLAAD